MHKPRRSSNQYERRSCQGCSERNPTRKAATALDTHHFVLLVGEPASGKTTIASLLAMSSADQWDVSVVKLTTPKSVVDHWNPHENSQLFWIDDAFGVTQYESDLVSEWNHVLNEVKTILRQGNRVVMTSRDYIYNRARQDLKEGAFPLFQEGQVLIDVHDLTVDERQQILYNHLKLGRQPPEFRAAVKPYLASVADHSRFIPETARRLHPSLRKMCTCQNGAWRTLLTSASNSSLTSARSSMQEVRQPWH